MNSFLMWVGGVLAGLLAALFAVPHFIDWNGYRGVFEEEASRILGRSVRVGGDVDLRLLPSPYVRFEKLRIADSSGLTGEPFFRAESFTMWLAVPPMLKGIMEAERIELDKPVVRLAANHQGVGNWGGFLMRPGSLPFVPSGVSLDSVNIVDGVLSVDVEGGGRLGQIDRINGELNATSLSGPFSFKGSARQGRVTHNVVVTTSEGVGRNGMRLKVRAQTPRTLNSYAFDGTLSGLDGAPKLTGALTSVVAPSAKGSKRGGGAASGSGLQISAQLSADTRAAVLRDITVALDSAGPPQTVVGDARVTWGVRHRMVLTMISEWLNLDEFLSSGGLPVRAVGPGAVAPDSPEPAQGTQSPDAPASAEDAQQQGSVAVKQGAPPPWKTARRLLDGLGGVLPSAMDVKAQFQLKQATLGGDAVSGLRLVLSRNGGPLSVETLRARLPGSARLEFSGVLSESEQGPGFTGDVFVGGPSLARVKSWALDHGRADAILSDGPFSISGKLKLGPESLEIRQARAEFSGVPVRGGVSWSGDGKSGRLSIDLTGQELNNAWIGLSPVDFSDLVGALGSGSAGLQAAIFGGGGDRAGSEGKSAGTVDNSGKADTTGQPSDGPAMEGVGWDLGTVDEFSIRIKAGKLINGNEVLTNVDANVLMKGDVLSIPAISFETPDGMAVELDGEIAHVEGRPKGEIRWIASAPNARAAKPIETLIEAGSMRGGGFGGFVAAAAPFRLAGKLDLGGRQAQAADIEFDGEVRGGRLVGRLLFDGGLEQWQNQPADITVTVDSPRWRSALNLLALGDRVDAVSSEAEMPMRGVFKAVGIPNSGMKAMGLARSKRLTLVYNGSVNVGDGSKGGGIKVERGEIVVAAADAGDVLALMGVSAGAGIEAARVDGLVDFERDGDQLVFRPRDLKIGSSTVAGRIAYARAQDGVQTIDADLVADTISLTSMMSALLGGPALQVSDGVGAAGDGESAGAGGEAVPVPKPAQPADGGIAAGEAAVAAAGAQASVLAAGVRRSSYVFSDAPFDLSALGRVRGRIALRAGSLGIGPRLTVSGVEVETVLKSDRVEVVLARGEAIGGTIGGRIVLEKGRAGVGLSGGFKIENALLERLTRWDETGAAVPMASGRATMKLDFSGRALSPRAVVSVLSGTGDIMLEDARVKGLGPEIVVQATDEVMARATSVEGAQGGRDVAGEDLKAALLERLALGELELGTRTVPIEIVDGAARLTPFSMKNEHGVTNARVTIDIGQLAVDSDFNLSAAAKGQQKAWPAVNVVFVGALGQIGAMLPLVTADALERELVVRKLEQNVSELERLRRLDQEASQRRLEREEERRREQEAARAGAAEEAQSVDVPIAPGEPGAANAVVPPVSGDGAPAPGLAGESVPGDNGVVPAPETTDETTASRLRRAAARARARRLRLKRKRRAPSPVFRPPSAGDVLRQQF